MCLLKKQLVANDGANTFDVLASMNFHPLLVLVLLGEASLAMASSEHLSL